jgi:hypothetical protein
MDNLLPCPMCGNNQEPKVVSSYDMDTEDLGNDEFFAVFCDAGAGLREVHKGCGASGGYAKTKELAISKWNTRQQLAEQTAGEPLYFVCDERTNWKMVSKKIFDETPENRQWLLYEIPLTVEVLLEALRFYAECKHYAQVSPKKVVILDRGEVASDALNAYSSKPQKHLDN